MKITAALPLALVSGLLFATEPAPRRLTGTTIVLDTTLSHISAVRELPDGRLLLTKAEAPAGVFLVETSGAVKVLGTAGAGPSQYAQPGGLYGGPGDSTYLVDRGLTRVLPISRAGAFGPPRSIAVTGTSGSWSADVDKQRVDARGFAYFTETSSGRERFDSVTLVRFDAAKQRGDTITRLRRAEQRVTVIDDHRTMSRQVIESPADGWGVAQDGRVAVIRAVPYHIEWYSPTGHMTRGPVIATDQIPITDDDKKRFASTTGHGGVSVGEPGATKDGTAADGGPTYAPFKAPFAPDSIIVSPAGRAWVMRSRPFGQTDVIYDVFDGAGERVDRVLLPTGSRIVGFGPSSIYVTESAAKAPPSLKRYSTR